MSEDLDRAVQRVRDLHQVGKLQSWIKRGGTWIDVCLHCQSYGYGTYTVTFPCPTIQALDNVPPATWDKDGNRIT